VTKGDDLTTHDLVVMAVLAEAPMHGYRVLQVLQERDVHDWAEMSKPQIYYSLKKLRRLKLVKAQRETAASVGPERDVLALTAAGRRALTDGLSDERWATQRPPPPFLTWLALSPHLDAASRTALIDARRRFLERELWRERQTLAAFAQLDDAMATPGRLMVDLTVRQFALELAWLVDVRAALGAASS
jgi:DNA-binding PadR family transcriptional regulator